MKPIHILTLVACSIFLFSCGSKKSDPQSPIVAKWTLQQDHAVLYKDGVKTLDTVLTAGGPTQGMAQFNSDGSYRSTSVFSTTNLYSRVSPSSTNVTGTYSYSASAFTVKPGLAGWFVFVAGSSTPATGYSSATQVTSLTGSNLNVATSNTFSVTDGTGAHTYTESNELFYTK